MTDSVDGRGRRGLGALALLAVPAVLAAVPLVPLAALFGPGGLGLVPLGAPGGLVGQRPHTVDGGHASSEAAGRSVGGRSAWT